MLAYFSNKSFHLTANASGEALLAFANIVTALVFLKSFWLTSNQSDLIGGAIFWVGTYIVGIALINFANRRKQNE